MAHAEVQYTARIKTTHPEHRLQPDPPGNRHAGGQAFVELADGFFLLGNRPARQEGVEGVSPVVLGSRVVGVTRDDRQQVLGKSDRGNHRGDHRHDIDRRQFPAGKTQTAPDRPGQGMGYSDEQEEDEQRCRRVVVVRQQPALDDHVRVGERNTDEQCQPPTDENGSQTYTAPVHGTPIEGFCCWQ